MKNEKPHISTFQSMVVENVLLSILKPLGREIRQHSKRKLKKLSKSVCKYGCLLPILITRDGRIVDGAAIVYVAKQLKWKTIQCVYVDDLTDEELRVLRLGLNRLCEEAQWNQVELKLEFQELFEINSTLDIDLTGFEMGEIDVLLTDTEVDEETVSSLPDSDESIVTQPGDLFLLDRHRVYCGDARDPKHYTRLMQGETSTLVLTDPPFNVNVRGHVSGNGRKTHDEFPMASGEMSDEEFSIFLRTACQQMKSVSTVGALHYLFMDWRHMQLLLNATQEVYASFLNLCVWAKSNGGMGSFYRSRHELIFIFKIDNVSHINNVELGKHGRYRSNVWEYPGCSSFGPDRDEMLAMHPTVKPLELVKDAILDASHRGDIVLDPFLGSGTTIMACEKTGRRGFGMEIDPKYVDVTIRRWQNETHQDAIHEVSGLTFNQLTQQRKENSHD